jgi:hypothetical protein
VEVITMDPASEQLARSLNGFRASLGRREVEAFNSASLREVQISLARIQLDQERINEMMNLPRMNLFLDAMVEFDKALSIFMDSSDPSKTTELMKFIWGPVKFLLQVYIAAYSLLPHGDLG